MCRVVKFGGSNLKNPGDLARIERVIGTYEKNLTVVVSAFFGITDTLIRALEEVVEKPEILDPLGAELLRRHTQMFDSEVHDQKARRCFRGELEDRIGTLNKQMLGIHMLGAIPDFARDKVQSFGERLASLTLSQVLISRGLAAREVLPEDLPLVTDGIFGNASVDLEASAPGASTALNGGSISVIPGFYGLSPDGQTTLLGRGGSDYAAASLARCLSAQSLDLWKDVPGFLTADPKLVSGAKPVSRLSYREAAELSYFGAQILHPRTFEPLESTQIPVRIFDIDTPEYPSPKTVIQGDREVHPGVVKSVSFCDDFGILKLIGPGVGIKPGIMAQVTSALHAEKINIKSIITSQTAINLLLARQDLQRAFSIVEKTCPAAVEELQKKDDISLIAIVGEGMLDHPGIAVRALSAVSRHGINILIIAAGGSVVATYFVIEKKDRQRAVQSVHEEFFNENVC